MSSGGGRSQPAAVRGAGFASGVLPGWRGAPSFLQGRVHHEAAGDHSSTSDWYRVDRHQGAGPAGGQAVAVSRPSGCGGGACGRQADTCEVFAAVPAKRRPQQKQGGQQGHHKGQQGQQVASGKSSKGTGGKYLCAKHAQYGEDAFFCGDKKNCTWSGN